MRDLPLQARDLGKSFDGEGRLRLPFPRWCGPRFAALDRTRRRLAAVDGVSFAVRRGEIYGVLGANGSGKSTLIRIVSTLLLPDAGSVTVFGHDVVQEAMMVRRLINRVSADPSFFRSMSALETLMFYGRVYGLTPAQVSAQAPAILERLGLERGRARKLMHQLSRGQQQKVAVARAFLTAPVLMLLDEPTAGLDPRSKRDVQRFIREVRADHDATVLLTTHDVEEAETLCDRIAFLAGGRLVAEGTPSALRRRVATERGLPLEQVNLETVFMDLTGDPCVRTLLIGAVALLFFAVDVGAADWAAVAVVLAVGSVSAAGLAVLAGVLSLIAPERGSQMTFMVQAAILLVSGVYSSVDVLPGWMRVISYASPATYILNGVRGAIQQGQGLGDLWLEIVVLALEGALARVGAQQHFIVLLAALFGRGPAR